jgi:hypothetical protein
LNQHQTECLSFGVNWLNLIQGESEGRLGRWRCPRRILECCFSREKFYPLPARHVADMAMLENLGICEFLGYRERGCKEACDSNRRVICFPQIDLNTPASIRILTQDAVATAIVDPFEGLHDGVGFRGAPSMGARSMCFLKRTVYQAKPWSGLVVFIEPARTSARLDWPGFRSLQSWMLTTRGIRSAAS